MAKQSDNFLRGWCRQLRQALDEGTELGYECAELVDEVLGLITPAGDAGDEMGLSDDGGGDDPEEGDDFVSPWDEQSDIPNVPGVVHRLDDVQQPGRDDVSAGVPRGTLSVTEPSALCKRGGRGPRR